MFHVTYWHCHGWLKWVTELHLKGWSRTLQDWSFHGCSLHFAFHQSEAFDVQLPLLLGASSLSSPHSLEMFGPIPMRYALWLNQLMLLLLTFLRFELESCVSLDSVSDESDFSRIKQYFQNDQIHKSVWFKNLVGFGMS